VNEPQSEEHSGYFARNPVALVVTLGVVSLLVGVAFFSTTGSTGFALVWVALALLVTAFNAVMLLRARRSDGATTGVALTPPEASLPVVPVRRWIGGASIPGRLGRMNATAPLAVLVLDGTQLCLQLRPAWLVRLFGGTAQYLVGISDGVEVFPTRGMFGTAGISLQPPSGVRRYFWTKRREEVLAAAASAGFSVTWEERKFVY
jgi:hypothetical protein